VAALDEQWVDFQAATKALETAVMLRATTRLSAVNEYRLEAGAPS
jgi:preprotein translocase subunit SecA